MHQKNKESVSEAVAAYDTGFVVKSDKSVVFRTSYLRHVDTGRVGLQYRSELRCLRVVIHGNLSQRLSDTLLTLAALDEFVNCARRWLELEV